MSEKVCAVVVTYNRKDLLRECLLSLQTQTRALDDILIVDNQSSDGTGEMLRGEFPNIHVLHMAQNLGGAGGFHAGMKLAYENGFDWIWIMDDDAEPKTNALEKLLVAADQLRSTESRSSEHILAVCPLIVSAATGSVQVHQHMAIDRYFRHVFLSEDADLTKGLLPLDADAFVGPMFSREGIKQLGLPRAEYFLWVDDLEYTYRFSQRGKCVLVTDAVIFHKDKPGVITPIKRYYQQRNYVDFILRRAPEFSCDKTWLRWRILKGLLYRMYISFKLSKLFLGKAIRKQEQFRLRDSMLPIVGVWHGLVGKTGQY